MSNAWLYYVGPLVICTVFVVAICKSLRRYQRGESDAKGNTYGRGTATFASLILLIVGGLGFAIVLTSPTPWQRQRLFDHIYRTDPAQIERFIIKRPTADQYRPLNDTEVVIDDPTRIREIAE